LSAVYVNQSNKLEREVKHKTGEPSQGPAKRLGGHFPPRLPLRTTTGPQPAH